MRIDKSFARMGSSSPEGRGSRVLAFGLAGQWQACHKILGGTPI